MQRIIKQLLMMIIFLLPEFAFGGNCAANGIFGLKKKFIKIDLCDVKFVNNGGIGRNSLYNCKFYGFKISDDDDYALNMPVKMKIYKISDTMMYNHITSIKNTKNFFPIYNYISYVGTTTPPSLNRFHDNEVIVANTNINPEIENLLYSLRLIQWSINSDVCGFVETILKSVGNRVNKMGMYIFILKFFQLSNGDLLFYCKMISKDNCAAMYDGLSLDIISKAVFYGQCDVLTPNENQILICESELNFNNIIKPVKEQIWHTVKSTSQILNLVTEDERVTSFKLISTALTGEGNASIDIKHNFFASKLFIKSLLYAVNKYNLKLDSALQNVILSETSRSSKLIYNTNIIQEQSFNLQKSIDLMCKSDYSACALNNLNGDINPNKKYIEYLIFPLTEDMSKFDSRQLFHRHYDILINGQSNYNFSNIFYKNVDGVQQQQQQQSEIEPPKTEITSDQNSNSTFYIIKTQILSPTVISTGVLIILIILLLILMCKTCRKKNQIINKKKTLISSSEMPVISRPVSKARRKNTLTNSYHFFQDNLYSSEQLPYDNKSFNSHNNIEDNTLSVVSTPTSLKKSSSVQNSPLMFQKQHTPHNTQRSIKTSTSNALVIDDASNDGSASSGCGNGVVDGRCSLSIKREKPENDINIDFDKKLLQIKKNDATLNEINKLIEEFSVYLQPNDEKTPSSLLSPFPLTASSMPTTPDLTKRTTIKQSTPLKSPLLLNKAMSTISLK